ncbi:phosphomevalonate kinase protein [Rutstroemia sp. NJR-2017a BBW]|nr:phosphomevalonate kinase protein [Rutstroemia sp. NJR-2017a BBW]
MTTAVSAPGKVFLAGGYLVLDRAYTALVFGLSARIHVLVQDIDTSSGVQLSEITVSSPQFRDATWNYGYHLTGHEGGIEVTQLQGFSFSIYVTCVFSPRLMNCSRAYLSDPYSSLLSLSSSPSATVTSRNPFVETALQYALTYISCVQPAKGIKPTSVTILADNDYYSHPSTKAIAADSKHQFMDFGVRLQDAHKTGLGSSAALVTAFTGAILSHYLAGQFNISTDEGRSKLHNLAQAAHCAAQGKVGSGFDIATAVYGTCLYRRFSPSILSSIGEPGSPGFATRVKSSVENTSESQKWDVEISKGKVTIPNGMALVMCDVDCGSQTVGMVKKVLEWRKQDPADSKALFDELQSRNEKLAEILSAGDIEAAGPAFSAIREKIREMGEKSGVPIEPAEQTALLDAVTENVEGVVGGVVPGAGGYDAIVLLVKDDKKTMDDIKEFLVKWSTEQKSNVKLLGVKGEMDGARKEDGELYGSLFN